MADGYDEKGYLIPAWKLHHAKEPALESARRADGDIIAQGKGPCLLCDERIEVGDAILPWINEGKKGWVHASHLSKPKGRIRKPPDLVGGFTVARVRQHRKGRHLS